MDKPKILFLDIETFPNRIDAWGIWEQNALDIVEYSSMCCFSVKWQDGKQITKGLPDYRGYKKGSRNDKALVKELWDIMNEADIIIAHNGDGFDMKWITRMFIKYRFGPTKPYKTVDTLKIARSKARFESNKLNDLGKYLGLGEKLETGGYKSWKGCMAGDKESWRLMKKYNAQDVLLLEKVYNVFLPFIKNHPNFGIYMEGRVCPKCGSNKVHKRGLRRNSTTVYQQYQCQSCGGWCADTKNIKAEKPLVNA